MAERKRQIDGEGWTTDHDDEHDDGSLLKAAVCYLWWGTEKQAALQETGAPGGWPGTWDAVWWKPKDRKSNLIRAGALCVADYDRRVRAKVPTTPATHKLDIAIRELASLLEGEKSHG